MKIQKEMRKFCPRCKTHSVQTLALYKRGKERTGAEGARRHAEDKKGYGGQKFPELKRTAKTTKKMTLRYTCKTCQYKTMKQGLRIRKLEIWWQRHEARKHDDAKAEKLISICSMPKMRRKDNSIFTHDQQHKLQIMRRAFSRALWQQGQNPW